MHCTQPVHFRADELEAHVLDRLKQFETPDEMKERIRAKARRRARRTMRAEWKNAKALVANLGRKLERLKDMRIEGEIDKGEYEKRKKKIDRELIEAEQNSRNAPPDVQALEELLPKIDQIASVVAHGNPAQQREILTALFEREEVRDSRIGNVLIRE